MLFNKIFDLIVSIGEDCACTSYLRRFNLQNYSYPFDWLTNATFETRVDLITSNFENFFNKEDIEFMNIHNPTIHDSYKNKKNNFYFYHDFKKNKPFEESYYKIDQKYKKRINRLYEEIEKAEKILFVWWSRDKHQDENVIIDSYKKLKEKFEYKEIYLLLIEPSESQATKFLCNNYVLVESFDNISYKHNPKWNVTMGNETNNMKFFSQIKKRRRLNWYVQIFIYKFVKIFINLIPNRNFRHTLRKAWSYNFFKDKL